MSITPSANSENRIRHWLESGRFPDADSVIEQALEALEDREQVRFQETRALILAGRNSGKGPVVTAEVWANILREADEEDRLGLPIPDEVQPFAPHHEGG